MEVVDHSDLALGTGLQQHRARAIAEDHAGRAVLVVDDRAHHIRSNHHHLLVHAALHQLRAHLQRIGKPRARRRKIEPPRALRANLVLDQARRRRKKHVRRHRRHDNHLYIGRRNPALLQAQPRRLRGQVAGRDPLVHNVPFADSGPLHDPLVAGRNHLLQIGVCQQSRRNVTSPLN